ncbi:PREDICTED: transcription repressor OFP8-like [Ipomoea nil]|uniref:transcription repressor OFP8-like n=1 Tax=Ipomoea nil TaxID=35883 RepID=UPI00090142F4|nr:PREDICTED: transcription repressor OFP8-like [Ipomoea nil]
MENRFKLKLSRFFRSCKAKNLSTDVVNLHDTTKTGFHDDYPPMNPDHHKRDYQLFELFSPKPRTFPSICRPRFPQTFHAADAAVAAAAAAVSPILPPYADFYYCGRPRRPRKRRKNKKATATATRNHIRRLDYDDFPAFEYKGLFSSSDEEENKDDDRSTLFSSARSLSVSSSESSASLRRRKNEEAAVKDSFAVVKRSSDPYGDFRASMLEMILEKQMFGAKDLEKLLECFLSLNSNHHHGVIIHVFTEICEALFSTCKA